LLLNPDGSKLSKRQAHTSLDWYKEQGYLPEAVIHFISELGWTPPDPDKQQLFEKHELIQQVCQ
jgi:glutamyl-tRNA synthetase